jgi:hypothetical protein
MELAPVQAQIALAQEIGDNKGYQEYLVTIRQVEAGERIGIEQAHALKGAARIRPPQQHMTAKACSHKAPLWKRTQAAHVRVRKKVPELELFAAPSPLADRILCCDEEPRSVRLD